MQIRNLHVIDRFKNAHADARAPMNEWIAKTLAADWSTTADLRETFGSASFVKRFVIFNIGGNKYRLLAEILYRAKTVRIYKAGTHDEYGRWKL